MKIGFIGPGKVGVNLGRYFIYNNVKVNGYYGNRYESTIIACNKTNSKLYTDLKDLVDESNIIFITTPDDNISSIDCILSKYDLKNKSIIHTSGSLQSTVLKNSKVSGAFVYSLHPIYAFSNKNIEIDEIKKINFSLEGENLNQTSDVIKLLKIINNKYFIRNIDDSAKYHLANVFVSNLVLSILDIGTSYFKDLGLSEKDALKAIYPLVQGNIQSIFEQGIVNSLTGPVARGDVNTIKKHITALKDKDRELYKILSINLLKITSEKYSTNKEEFFEESKKHKEIYNILGGIE